MTSAAVTVEESRASASARRSARRKASDVLWIVVLLFVGAAFAFPILWALLSSFKSTDEIIKYELPLTLGTIVPYHPTLENYAILFKEVRFQINILNTLIAGSGQVLFGIIISTLAGYAFARLKFFGRDVIFGILLLGAFIPVEAILVPLYRIVHSFGLNSTYVALFLPFIANPFGIYLMRQSFREVPVELEEAGRLDGAGTMRIFFSIVLPNVRPAIATLVLIQFIWSWNAYVWPLVIMQDPNKQIAQVAIANLKSIPNFPMDGPLFAAVTAVTVPLVVLSIALQRYYVRGMITSGMR